MKKERSGNKKWEEEEEKEKREGKETSPIRFSFFVCYGLMFMVPMPPDLYTKNPLKMQISIYATPRTQEDEGIDSVKCQALSWPHTDISKETILLL